MQDYYHSLYTPKSEITEKTPIYLRPEQIQIPQGRKPRDQSPNTIIRLAESIKKYGILEPLSVKISDRTSEHPVYELVAGERRLRAAMIAHVDKIPCILLSTDSRSCAIAGILGNLQREGLHIFEQAAAFRMLMQDFSLTQEEIARKLGISQSAVANKLRLLKLSREEQQEILSQGLTERHARTILRLKNREQRTFALHRIGAERLNVAATERLIEEILAGEPTEAVKSPTVTVVLSPERPPSGVCPRKFAIPDLTPLYNSIERTLSIFRKTGATATCRREEGEEAVRIVIEVPKNA